MSGLKNLAEGRMRKRKRKVFYKMLLYVIFLLLVSKVDTEVKSILGRADVVIQTPNDVFVQADGRVVDEV